MSNVEEDYRDFHLIENFPIGHKYRYPPAYDLVNLMLDDGRILPGWHNGNGFTGFRVKASMKVIGWQRRKPM